MKQQSSYYIAVIVSRSSSTAIDYVPLCEESFVLLEATSLDEATEKAMARTVAEENQYENVYGDTITWSPRLVELGDALQDTFEDGSELYARFFRNHEAYEQLDFQNFSKEQ